MSTDELSLDLRLRFLESILNAPPSTSSGPQGSLSRRLSILNQQLDNAISESSTDAVRRFVKSCAPAPQKGARTEDGRTLTLPLADELNEPLLRAPTATNPNPDELPPATKLLVVLEAEQEVRQLERELRELDALDSRGVVGAGSLGGQSRLYRTSIDRPQC